MPGIFPGIFLIIKSMRQSIGQIDFKVLNTYFNKAFILFREVFIISR